jgi:ribose-phosphate pyrophosphokinase
MIKVNGEVYEYAFYPAGELIMSYEIPTSNEWIYIEWNFENLIEQVVLYNLVLHINEQDPSKKMCLRMEYCPNGRMDRIKDYSEVFTLKYFATFLNNLPLYEVTILDPHSNVTPALIDRVYVDSDRLESLIEEVMGLVKPDLIYYPDESAKKKYGDFIKHPSIYGVKDRDWKTGKIKSVLTMNPEDIDLKGRSILMVDDICSKGGSYFYGGKALKELGVGKLYLFISHCENSILDGELINSGLLERIYTTRSILTIKHPLIEVIGEE